MLYHSASERHDNCAHCRASRPVTYQRGNGDKSYYCDALSRPVSAGGHCAGWKSMPRRFITVINPCSAA